MNYRPVLTRSIATLIAAFTLESAAHADSGTWNVDANGNWNAAGSWAGGTIADGADNTANFRFNITGTRTITLDTPARTIGNLVFEDLTTVSSDWVLSSSAASNVLTLDVSTGQANISVINRTATINTVLAGTDGINVTAPAGTVGNLVLAGANTFTGGLTITGGIVQLNNALAAGSNTITVDASQNTALANRLQINGGVAIANNIVINGGAAPVAGFGAIHQTGTGQSTVNGTITINGATANGGHFVGGGAGNELVLNGVITSSVGVVQREGRVIYRGGGTGYTFLTVTNTALVGATNGISTDATVSLGGSAAATLNLNGFDQSLAGLVLGNAGNVATVAVGAQTLTLTGGLTSQGTVAHSITGTGTIALGNNNISFEIGDSAAFNDVTIAPNISGTAGFTKAGAGTLILNGNVTNTGPISVLGGTLGGTSTISGLVTLDFGTTLQPGTISTGGTMTASALTLGSSSTVTLNLGSSSDFLDVTTPQGLTINNGAILNIAPLGGPIPVGSYNLIGHSGSLQGAGLAGLQLTPLGHSVATLTDNGNTIVLNVTSTDSVVWSGAFDGIWDNNFSQNWKTLSNNAATTYLEGDDVIFNDTGNNTTIFLDAQITPSRVTFTNTAAVPYVISGIGGINGTGLLNKTGDGTVTLQAVNGYTGATTISAGTLELDHDVTGNVVLTNTSGVSVAAGATLKLTRDDGNITFNRNISGAGTVVIDPHSAGGSASRDVTISGNNTGFTGLWKLTSSLPGTAGGSYRTVTNATTFGAATLDVDSGAQLWIADNATITNNITISGIGYAETAGSVPIGLGALTNGVYVGTGTPLFSYGGIGAIRLGANSNLSGNITVDGDTKIMAFNQTGTISGSISSTSASDTLVIGGGTSGSTMIFTGANTYGKTLVNSGSGTSAVTHILQIGNNGTTGTLGTGDVVLYGSSAATGFLRISRSNGYALAAGQNILGAAGTSADLIRTSVGVNTTGTGLTLNGNTIDLSDGTNGGNLFIAGNSGGSGVNGAILNLTGASVVDVGNLYIGDQANNGGTLNIADTSTVSVINQIRVGHYSTETSNLNISGGSLTVTAPAPSAFPYATVAPTEQNGGIYLGVDGTGNLTQSGGTVSTNFVVLDNRAESGFGSNMPTGVDTYSLNGGTLILKSAFGIITRNASTLIDLTGGTIQAATGISPNLDTNKIRIGGPVTLDTNGANTFTLYGPLAGTGTLNLTGGGILRTQDGTGATATQVGGTMPGGSLGTASINISGTSTLQANRTGVDTWSGAITGSGAFIKQNTGTLNLTGNGSGYTGATTIAAGRLNLPTNFASPTVTVADGAALGGEPTIANLTLGSTAGGTVFFNPLTTEALNATSLTVNGTATLDFTAVPAGPGPVIALKYGTKSGAGTFALANAANYRSATVSETVPGTVTVDVTRKNLTWTGAANGTWDLKTSANWTDGAIAETFFAGDSVTFDDSATATAVTLTGTLSPWQVNVTSNTKNYTLTGGFGGPGSLVKSGTSTLTLTGTNTYSGQTVINGGTLSIAAATAIGDASPTNNIAINGGTLRTTATPIDLGAARAVAIGSNGATLSAGTGSTLTVSGAVSGTGALGITGGGVFILSGDNSAFTGNVNVDSAGATSGATTLRLSSNTALTAGIVSLTPPGAPSASGSATGLDLAGVTIGSGVSLSMTSLLSGTTSFRSQLTTSAGVNVWNGPIILNGDSINQINTTHSLTLNGPVTAGTGGFTGTFFLRGGSPGIGVVNGIITAPNATLGKTDNGTWIINSTGNSWGNTTVAVGTLRMGAASVLPATTNLTLGQNDTNAATLDLSGFNQTIASLASNPATGTNANSKTITSATPATLTVNQASNTTYGSIISANMSLIKDGAGSLTLAGANTFTGNVSVNGGTLVAGGTTVTSLGSATTAGRTVDVNNGSTLSFTTNNVFGNGVNNNNLPSVTLNSSTLTSTRYNILGNLTLNGGTLTQAATDSGNYEGFQFRGTVTVGGTAPSLIETTNGKANHLGANTIFDVADVTGSSARDLLVSSPLRNQSGDFGSAAGGLTKTGAGTLELAGINNYTGSTVVDAGTLLVSGAISGDIIVNSGGTLAGEGTTGPVSVPGGIVTPGDGIGTLTTDTFSLTATSTLRFELAQAGVVGNDVNDLISILGDLILDGTLLLNEQAGFTRGTYRLFNYTGALTDAGLNIDPAFLTAHPGSRIETSTLGQIDLVVVPEPGALMSLLGGASVLLGFRRARRVKA